MKIFFNSVLVLFALLITVFIIWYSNVGSKNLYYIEEIDMYIKTFPSRETSIIAFSDKRIDKFSDTLDYVIVHKGDDYGTGFLFDPNKKNMIYDAHSNSISEIHMIRYTWGEIAYGDTTYYNKYNRNLSNYLLKSPYVKLNFYFCGSREELSLKNGDNNWTTIKPIGK